MWELDVVEMFPRLDRQKVLDALKAIHKLVGEARKVRGKNPQCSFALHHCDRRLDRMGQGSARRLLICVLRIFWRTSSTNFSATTSLLLAPGYCDNVGGWRSGAHVVLSWLASTACIKNTNGIKEDICHMWIEYGHGCTPIPLYPFRFRDNIVGVGWGDVTLQASQGYFSEV